MRMGLAARNPDQDIQDRQETKNSAAPQEHSPSRAVPGSSARRWPLPGIHKKRGKVLVPPEPLDRSRRARPPE